jgi:hypothetical protein
VLGDLVEETLFKIEAHTYGAFKGYDIYKMGYKTSAHFPFFSMPSARELSQ